MWSLNEKAKKKRIKKRYERSEKNIQQKRPTKIQLGDRNKFIPIYCDLMSDVSFLNMGRSTSYNMFVVISSVLHNNPLKLNTEHEMYIDISDKV